MQSTQTEGKYINLRLTSKDQQEQQNILMDAQEVQLQIQADLLTTQREMFSLKNKLIALKSATPSEWSTNDVISTANRITRLEEAESQIKALLEELF